MVGIAHWARHLAMTIMAWLHHKCKARLGGGGEARGRNKQHLRPHLCEAATYKCCQQIPGMLYITILYELYSCLPNAKDVAAEPGYPP